MSITAPAYKLLDLNRQEHQIFIWEQLAAALQVPLLTVLDLSNQQGLAHKRVRLDTDIYMPTSYTGDFPVHDGQEKPLPAGQLISGVNAGGKPYGDFGDSGVSSGWGGTRLARCFAGISMCPPCSPFESRLGTLSCGSSSRQVNEKC